MRSTLAAIVLIATTATASAQFQRPIISERGNTITIHRDNGGEIGRHLEYLAGLKASGKKIRIAGPCRSACTMLLGIVPPERVCATRGAKFGFHAAWRHGYDGRPVMSHEGTALLRQVYNRNVNGWIDRNGGLTPELRHANAQAIGVSPCDPPRKSKRARRT